MVPGGSRSVAETGLIRYIEFVCGFWAYAGRTPFMTLLWLVGRALRRRRILVFLLRRSIFRRCWGGGRGACRGLSRGAQRRGSSWRCCDRVWPARVSPTRPRTRTRAASHPPASRAATGSRAQSRRHLEVVGEHLGEPVDASAPDIPRCGSSGEARVPHARGGERDRPSVIEPKERDGFQRAWERDSSPMCPLREGAVGLVLRVRCHGDHGVVVQGRINLAVQTQFDDAPIAWMPWPAGFGAAEDVIERVDRWFPQIQPVAPTADGEAELQRDRPAGERCGGAELVMDLLFEGSLLTRCAGPDRVDVFDGRGFSTGAACSTRMNDVSPWFLVHHADTNRPPKRVRRRPASGNR
jgi:hypothetical protein